MMTEAQVKKMIDSAIAPLNQQIRELKSKIQASKKPETYEEKCAVIDARTDIDMAMKLALKHELRYGK